MKMASFTYTVWTNEHSVEVVEKLKDVFLKIGFDWKNPESKMCHIWSEDGECDLVDEAHLYAIAQDKLPLSIQWWRGDDDIFVTLAAEKSVGGTTCYVRLVGLSRVEEAEIGKLLIIGIVPGKQEFPDDFSVFQLSAE